MHKSHEQRIAEAKSRITEITAADARARREQGDDAVFLDVREQGEWNLFRIPGAVHVPLGQLDESITSRIPTDKRVVVYCARGNRSALAADAMQQMGYGDVTSLKGGIADWSNAGGEIDN